MQSIYILAFVTLLLTSCKNSTETLAEASNTSTEVSTITKNTSQASTEKTTIPEPTKDAKPLSKQFKDYWYAGEAELTSYDLKMLRYGEMRNGKAVLVYVTEPFLAKEQVKANGANDDNIPVLKLNHTKSFNTGIYPYSIMSSTFYPVDDNRHALKVTNSIQEWCGQTYLQLNNRDAFDIMGHSYFEGEADEEFSVDKTVLEDEIWAQLRINPTDVRIGSQKIIPSFEYLRLNHKPIKAYTAIVSSNVRFNKLTTQIEFPELNRTVTILQDNAFPYGIEFFSEKLVINGQSFLSSGKKIKTIKSPYWEKNGTKDAGLRDELGL